MMTEPIRDPRPTMVGPVVMADGWHVSDDGEVTFDDVDPQASWERFRDRVSTATPEPGLQCPYRPCGWLTRGRDLEATGRYEVHAVERHLGEG